MFAYKAGACCIGLAICLCAASPSWKTYTTADGLGDNLVISVFATEAPQSEQQVAPPHG